MYFFKNFKKKKKRELFYKKWKEKKFLKVKPLKKVSQGKTLK